MGRGAALALAVTLVVPATWGAGFSSRHLSEREWPVARVAAKVGPSVVGVVNEGLDPLGRLRPRASGSGVVVRPGGYIVTNYHVVEGARRLRVVLASGRSVLAALVGVDPGTDLAVVRVPGISLRVARLADSQKVRVGELAVAIGNPMGLGFARSVTAGVVSGVDRSLGGGYARRAYDLIQTDAAINPGNSGGALVNGLGEVVGINSVKIAAPGVEGMGFAIPSSTVREVVRAIIAHGYVPRPWLGLKVLGADAAEELGLLVGPPRAPVVERLYPGGPGARAGLERGDRLVRLNDRKLRSVEDLYRTLARFRVGEHVRLAVWRRGQSLRVDVALGRWPAPTHRIRPRR